jgi:VanZ family protein
MKPHKIAIILMYTGLMLGTSIIPMEVGVPDPSFVSRIPPSWQNLLHLPMFALFALLLLDAAKSLQLHKSTTAALTVALALGFGVFLELLQMPIPGRYPSLTDMLFNILGACIGIALYVSKTKLSHGSLL